MPADFDHVVHTALNPYIAIAIHSSSITGKVDPLNRVPVRLVTGRVAKDCAHLSRPRVPHNQKTTFPWRNGVYILVNDIGLDGRQWAARAAWLVWKNRCGVAEYHARYCLPTCVHD